MESRGGVEEADGMTDDFPILAAVAASPAHPYELLEHLLWNRLGKSDLDALSKTEAVQFMVYMRSPGGALR